MEKISFSWLKHLGRPSPAQIKYMIASNGALVTSGVAFGGIFLFLSLVPYAPTIQSTLNATPDWASGFDIYITFPLLTILCLLPFRTLSKWSSVLLVSLVAGIPIALILESYYLFYGLSPGGWVLGTPLTFLVPTVVLVAVLAVPTASSILLCASLPSSKKLEMRSSFSLGDRKVKYYFLGVACASVILALLQTYVRVASGASLNGWVTDVGITVEAGARDLVQGINPYTHGLPPWGGPGGAYGPITYLGMVPFVFFPQGWAAHAGALFYALITSVGIWKCMQLFYPKIAALSALLFLALPTTSWIIEGGIVSHVMLAALIVWSLYFFFRGSYFSAGLVSAIGLLTLVIPGILIIPYLVTRKNKGAKLRTALGYFVPIVLGVVGFLVVFPPSFLFGEVQGTLIYQLGGQGGFTLDALFSSTFIRALSLILTGWLVFWFIFKTFKSRYANSELLSSIATFMILIPFATGDYFAFFYIWASAVAVLAIFGNSAFFATAQDSRLSAVSDVQTLQNIETG
jgi:hypothetical protein